MEKSEAVSLIPRCVAGDGEAREALVVLTQDRVYYHCKKMLKNEEDALDATQEVLISMLTKLGARGLLGLAELHDGQLLPQRPAPGRAGGADAGGRGGQQPAGQL